MSDKDIESEIQAKGLTAPRVTPDRIESIIAQEAYFTAEDGAFGVAIKAKHTGGEVNTSRTNPLSLLTFRHGAAQRLHRHWRKRLRQPGKLRP
jgi:hypothetical protein